MNSQCTQRTVQAQTGPAVVSQCTAVATVTTDPILQSFDGQSFEFLGASYHNYSLLAGPDVAVTMQLFPAGPRHIRHQTGEGTFIGGVAVVLPTLKILAHVPEEGNATFTINGASAALETEATFEDGLVSYRPFVPGLGQVLTVTQLPFNIQLVAVKAFTDDVSGYNRAHFDISVEALSAPQERFSGVLGELLYKEYNPEQPIEEGRFEVPSLSDTHIQSTLPARRLLTPGLLSVISFPATAHVAMGEFA